MCGIVGYIGNDAVRRSVEKVKLLQYRGYDSAGVGFVQNGKIRLEKAVGSVDNLNADYDGFSAIAHVRWATHGKVNTINAHPHKSGENWAIVHNGIIENYQDFLCEELQTETDSEVISLLLEKHGKGLDSVLYTARKLEGSFAVLALEKSGKIYAVKNKSPLFVAKGNDGVIFASDPVCFCGLADTYYTFCDNEVAVSDGQSLEFYDIYGNVITKKAQANDAENTVYEKGDFDTFMRREIYDIPSSLRRVFQTYTGEYLDAIVDSFDKACEVWFIGCGTAYHACLAGENLFCKAGKKCRSFIASEFRYSPIVLPPSCICVFISQSGETADTIGALEKVENSCKTVALTSVGYSSLARRVDLVLPTLAGKERAVASTKAYACQITVLSLIASALSSSVPYFESVSEQSIKEMESVAKRYAQKFSHNEIFILGRGLDYVTAKECALKIKEVSYVNANAYPTGELKHGFIALLTRDTPVIMFAFDKDLIKKNISGALECKSRGASVVVITPFVSDFCDEFDVVEISSPLRAVAYSFLFALELSLARKFNPDMPKNLAKSVTVE